MKKALLFIVILAVTGAACGLLPNSWETEGVVAVMADQADWDRLHPDLSRVFERVTRTPQKETAYTLVHVSEEDFTRYTKYKYLVLVATLDSRGRVGEIVNKVVSNPEIRAQVERGDRFLITQEGQWSRDQFMLILVGKDAETLGRIMEANSGLIFDTLDDVVTDRIKKIMYKRREQKALASRLMSTYNWSLRMQHDFFIPQEFPDEGFMWFRRIFPERWIFIRWIDGGRESDLNERWVVGERNRVGAKYYSGDYVESSYLFSYHGEFLGRPAIITTGLWGNDDKIAGGPFRNYTFYDEYTKRIYMIDLAVYAPNRDKLPYLKRLDIIAHSFKTIFDMETE
ncbi:DUF4837 family protein [bacterium]|nr:DUF4837 family protein [bacterium]